MYLPQDPTLPGNTPLDPTTSVSPVMLALLKVRARQYLRYGADSIREARSYKRGTPGHEEALRDAERFLGVAAGTIFALYDTRAVAYRYLRVLEGSRRALALTRNGLSQ